MCTGSQLSFWMKLRSPSACESKQSLGSLSLPGVTGSHLFEQEDWQRDELCSGSHSISITQLNYEHFAWATKSQTNLPLPLVASLCVCVPQNWNCATLKFNAKVHVVNGRHALCGGGRPQLQLDTWTVYSNNAKFALAKLKSCEACGGRTI